METNTRQTSFGIVEYRDIEHIGATCKKTGCPNTAVIQVLNKPNNEIQRRCKLHARNSWLEEINYE